MLIANGGDNILYGGSGNDSIFGESDNDLLQGEADNDTLYGARATIPSTAMKAMIFWKAKRVTIPCTVV